MSADPHLLVTPPLEVAHRIHQKCEEFEDRWNSDQRPQLATFLGDVDAPERTWLLAELLALELELRQGAGEQPTEAEYMQLFSGERDRDIIAAAFRRCAEFEGDLKYTHRTDDAASRASTVSKIDGYEMLEVLGRGGMGVVYKARDLRLKRLVALKLILAGDHAGGEHLERFRDEAEMVARLQHPNIVQIFDIGDQEGCPYIAFEFIEGQTLADRVGREPQPPRAAAELVEVLARAMQYAHERGIVHRDLKPANILLAGRPTTSTADSLSGSVTHHWPSTFSSGMSGQHATSRGLVPKITDFGLAKDLGANLDRTSTGIILGTPLYMSPEQAEGRRDIGPASDIYSLGAILYVLLTGRPPLQGTSAMETLKLVVSAEPVPPSQMQPHLPRDIETICLKCLDKDPARRYETAGALADDLRRFLNDEPILARASGRIEKTRRWCRRNPAVASLMAAVLLVLIAGVGVSGYFAYSATREAKEARAERDRAEANAQRARERAYVSDVRELQRAWENRLFIRFLDLLDAQRPARTDNVDLRGFEWHYWRRMAKSVGIIGRHKSVVRTVSFSPNGKLLASASHDRTVKVWDVETGQEKFTFKRHNDLVTVACFSPNGKRIVSGSSSGERTVKLWDAETGEEILNLHGFSSGLISVGFSPDGKQIFTCSLDGVQLWDAETGQEKLTLKGHAVVSSGCISPDGKRIASGSQDGTTNVWDAETGQELFSLRAHTQAISSVTFSHDGRRLATASNDRTFKVWDAQTGAEQLAVDGQSNALYSICFSPDGTRLATTSEDSTMRLWDAQTGRELSSNRRDLHAASVMFSPDGKRIAAGGEGTVRIWDVEEATRAPVFEGHQSQVTSVASSPNGRWLASSGGLWVGGEDRYENGELRLWDARSGALLHDLGGHSSGVTSVAFSPDSRYLASGSGVWDEANKRYQSGEVRLWDPTSGAILYRLEEHASSVLSLTFSSDGRVLASGDFTGRVLVRRVPHGEDAFMLPGLSKGVATLAFSPDGRFLAAGGFDQVVKVWNLTDRSEVASLPSPVVISGVAFRPDGKQLAVAGYTNELQLYDTTTYNEVQRLQGHTSNLTHVAYSPDGRRIATSSEDLTVRLWDSQSGQELLTLKGHTQVVRSVEFSADGQRLFSSGWDRTIRVWDATPID